MFMTQGISIKEREREEKEEINTKKQIKTKQNKIKQNNNYLLLDSSTLIFLLFHFLRSIIELNS